MANIQHRCIDEKIEQRRVEEKMNKPDMDLYLIAFKDGSYKKVKAIDWKHSRWIHFTLRDGSVVRVNPENVNYLHQGVENIPEPEAVTSRG